jgi:hydroxymethylpyrimidine pyrophosphatase-like HAD family hydrolase
MHPVVFLDLDDTIFQTYRKCGTDRFLAVGAVGKDGQPMSFMTAGQKYLLDEIFKQARLIPATARNLGSFARVRLSFTSGAILDFGGLIIAPDGRLDEKWLEIQSSLAYKAEPFLEQALAAAKNFIEEKALDCRVKIVFDAGLPFYLMAKSRSQNISNQNLSGQNLSNLEYLYEKLKDSFYGQGIINLNGNNLTLRPNYLDKAKAVEFFIQNHLPEKREELVLFGFGDSLSDLGFLRLCDFMIIPSNSQLGQLKIDN